MMRGDDLHFFVLSNHYELLRALMGKYLFDNDSERDDVTGPPSSILDDMKNEVNALFQHSTDSCVIERKNAMLGLVYYLYACYRVEKEETEVAKELFFLSLSNTSDDPVNSYNVLVRMAALNEVSVLHNNCGDQGDAISCLKKSEEQYIKFSQLAVNPVSFFELMTNKIPDNLEEGLKVLDKIHTLTLYYLAQAYRLMTDAINSALYCYQTLKRQLSADNLDRVEWALNAATLSQFFIEKHAFREARNFLAASSEMLDRQKKELDTLVNECNREEMILKITHISAEVARCWAKFCINILQVSRDRLMEEGNISNPPNELLGLEFSTLRGNQFENSVSYKYCLTYDDAKLVFVAGLKWLSEAASFYTLEENASDHIVIMQDQSTLYDYLTFFEEDESRQFKLLKRRVILLTNLCNALNPESYGDILRDLWFELGDVLWKIIEIKLAQVPQYSRDKINKILMQCIDAYARVINSLKETKYPGMPKFPAEYERTALVSYIFRSRAISKLFSTDHKVMMENTLTALQGYEFVVQYYEKWHKDTPNDEKPLLGTDIHSCHEMVSALPGKLLRYHQAQN